MAALKPAEPDLRTYVRILRRRYYWVVAAVVLLGAGAYAYTKVQPKQYTASAQLLVQPTSGTLPSSGTQQVISPTDVLTELQLLTTAPVEAKVRAQLGSAPAVTASEVGATNVIEVSATSRSPKSAAKIANAYANAFVSYEQTVTSSNLTAAEQQLQSQIASIDAQVTSLQGTSSTSPQIAALLTQETTLKEELATLQVSGAVSGGGVEVVTPASAPTSPSSPQPVRDTLIGIIIGLLLGIVLALLFDHFDDAVYSKEEAARLARDAPVLGVVPKFKSWKRRSDVVLATIDSHNSSVAEAYRSLRTSLKFAGHDGTMKTILVTSPSPGEGKTSTIANLGVVLAQADQRVAVVSGDLRRPRLGQFFERSESPGFTSVILGQCTLDDALQTVEGVHNLFFLGSGDVPPNPTELLASEAAKEIFSSLRKSFDVVLLDSPPVLPVTDATILARETDATLLVIAAGETKRHQVEEAAEILAQVTTTRVGVILNEVEVGGGYGYRDSYGSYSSYAPSTPVIAFNGNGKAGAKQGRRAGVRHVGE